MKGNIKPNNKGNYMLFIIYALQKLVKLMKIQQKFISQRFRLFLTFPFCRINIIIFIVYQLYIILHQHYED